MKGKWMSNLSINDSKIQKDKLFNAKLQRKLINDQYDYLKQLQILHSGLMSNLSNLELRFIHKFEKIALEFDYFINIIQSQFVFAIIQHYPHLLSQLCVTTGQLEYLI